MYIYIYIYIYIIYIYLTLKALTLKALVLGLSTLYIKYEAILSVYGHCCEGIKDTH